MDSALGDGESISSIHTAHKTATGVSSATNKTTPSTRQHLKETTSRLVKTLAEKAEQTEALEKENAASAQKDKEIVENNEAQIAMMQKLLAEKFNVNISTLMTPPSHHHLPVAGSQSEQIIRPTHTPIKICQHYYRPRQQHRKTFLQNQTNRRRRMTSTDRSTALGGDERSDGGSEVHYQ